MLFLVIAAILGLMIPSIACGDIALSEVPGYVAPKTAGPLAAAAALILVASILSCVSSCCLRTEPIAQQQLAPREMSPVAARNYGYTTQTPVPIPQTDTTGAKVVVENHSPMRHDLPIERPLPEGSDWVLEGQSGLHWSDTKKLWFDRASGQFYDPSTEKWFNPDQNIWYKL